MSENQPEQLDSSEIEDAQVDVGAQPAEPAVEEEVEPEGGGNSRAPQPTEPESEGDADEAAERTDASGRVLNAWESDPKGSKE